MSLYRQPGRVASRTLVLGVAAALVVGLGGGYAIGRATAPEKTLSGNVAELRGALRPAREGIELSATEYAQAVKGGRVVAPTEYQAATADVARARSAVAGARDDLRALDPHAAADLDAAVGALGAAIAAKAGAAEVGRLSDRAGRALEAALPTAP
jgi:hypothetical protein